MFNLRFSRFALASCLLAGCATSRPPPTTQSIRVPVSDPSAASAPPPAAQAGECKLYCEPPRFVPRVAPDPDYTQREIDNASTVLASMTDDLLGCYKARLRANPKAHGFITVDILIGDDGRVRKIDTTGGAILGEITMACIVHRIQRGVFDPPHGGGNIHVQVPFTLRLEAPDDET